MIFKTKKERDAYFIGYHDGQRSTIKHNLHLLKNQLNPPVISDQKELKEEEKKIEKVQNKLYKAIEKIGELE